MGTAVSRPLALLADLFCKIRETDCLVLRRAHRDIQILQTDQGIVFVTMFDLTELFTIGFKVEIYIYYITLDSHKVKETEF